MAVIGPGHTQWNTRNIPRVVGGVDDASTEVASLLYEQVVDSVVPVSATTVAEMVKLLENTFRAVNIGLANELALMCRRLGVDVWEVIDAAKTKPFGYMPFYPGPGLGGHCIPIDPFYLSWKAKQNGFESRFIELAGHINSGMPRSVVERIGDALNSSVEPEDALIRGIDCAVITTDHHGFDYLDIAQRVPVVVDTRNALKGVDRDNIFRL